MGTPFVIFKNYCNCLCFWGKFKNNNNGNVISLPKIKA